MLQHKITAAYWAWVVFPACESIPIIIKMVNCINGEMTQEDMPCWSCGVNYSDVTEGQVRCHDASNPGPQFLSCLAWTWKQLHRKLETQHKLWNGTKQIWHTQVRLSLTSSEEHFHDFLYLHLFWTVSLCVHWLNSYNKVFWIIVLYHKPKIIATVMIFK